MKTKLITAALSLTIVAALPLSAAETSSAQFPNPANAAEVPGPAAGNTMTKEYVQMVGRTAYFWGWGLVNYFNRHAAFSKVPEPGLLGGVLPIGHNAVAMLTGYMAADQRFIACSNQDVVYGIGFLDNLDNEPIVFQVPDFGDRFYVYALWDARADEFSTIGQQYGTKPGFYMIVGPNWKGETPQGITAVVRSSTTMANAAPRVLMDDTPEDQAAVQPLLNQIVFYPLSQFDGKMKTKDWSKAPHFPAPKSSGSGETKWVNPETFFDELPAVMKAVPPLPGEEALYKWIGSVLEAAEKDPAVKQTLKETAVASDAMITSYLQWRYNGRAAGNGWNSQINNAQWGTDYLNRTATSKSNMFENRPDETKYIYTDNDSQGQQMDGHNNYTITFPKGQTPPVKGFWSVTLYGDTHFFNPNPLKRYSLGTKNKNLVPNADGSLTLYAGAKSPGKDKENNWLPAPNGTFSLYIRCYWPEQAVLDGTWTAPKIEKLK